jgi:hypothetical protein
MIDFEQRREAHQQLERLVHEILFAEGGWPADVCRLRSELIALGLEENIPGDHQGTRVTLLGRNVNVDLYSVFLGLFDWSEIPNVLQPMGLFTWKDSDFLWSKLEEGDEAEVSEWLKAKLQVAHRNYFGQSHNN